MMVGITVNSAVASRVGGTPGPPPNTSAKAWTRSGVTSKVTSG